MRTLARWIGVLVIVVFGLGLGTKLLVPSLFTRITGEIAGFDKKFSNSDTLPVEIESLIKQLKAEREDLVRKTETAKWEAAQRENGLKKMEAELEKNRVQLKFAAQVLETSNQAQLISLNGGQTISFSRFEEKAKALKDKAEQLDLRVMQEAEFLRGCKAISDRADDLIDKLNEKIAFYEDELQRSRIKAKSQETYNELLALAQSIEGVHGSTITTIDRIEKKLSDLVSGPEIENRVLQFYSELDTEIDWNKAMGATVTIMEKTTAQEIREFLNPRPTTAPAVPASPAAAPAPVNNM